jgi:hypothetical protein
MHRNLVDARPGSIGVSTSSAMGEAISVYSEMDSFQKSVIAHHKASWQIA